MKFEVLQQAEDLQLLDVVELRLAAGLAYDDVSVDEDLLAFGLRAAARIASSCMVAKDGVIPPTLRLERLRDTFRLKSPQVSLHLSRRALDEIVSLTEDGVALSSEADFEVDAGGRLVRLHNDVEACWSCSKVIIEYYAGYEVVPDALKAVTSQLVAKYWSDRGADRSEKSLNIPGLIATERWVDATADNEMPADLMQALVDGGFVDRAMVL